MNKRPFKAAAVSIEIAISIGLAVIVLFVTLGLFSDNLVSLTKSTNFSAVFSGTTAKKEYSSYNKQYASSQIITQIIGAQGLEMLRRKANNKAIELIEESFSAANSNAASIAYLSTAIKIITGENHICAFMKEDSDRHCDELTEGYNYKLNVSGSALLMKKVDKTGVNTEDTVSLPIDSVTSSILSSVNIPLDEKGYPLKEESDKYSLIQDISDKIKNQVRSDVLLMGKSDTFISDSHNAQIQAKLNFISNKLNKIEYSVNTAYQGCNGTQTTNTSVNSNCNYKITASDTETIDSWIKSLAEKLSYAEPAQFNAVFNESLNLQTDSGVVKRNIITILQKDTYNSTESQACNVLKSEISEINNHYNGANIYSTTCTPGRSS